MEGGRDRRGGRVNEFCSPGVLAGQKGGGVREIAFGGRELARSSCEIRLNLVAEREGERGKEKESGGESK